MALINENMSTNDIIQWLAQNGFSEEVQKSFDREEMDGEALFDAFGCQSGPDCLKDVVPKYGQRVKVYKAIKLAMSASLIQQDQGQDVVMTTSSNLDVSKDSGCSDSQQQSPVDISKDSSCLDSQQQSPLLTTESAESATETTADKGQRKKCMARKGRQIKMQQKFGKTCPSPTFSIQSSSATLSSSSDTRVSGKLPDPFIIPLFRQSTEEHLDNKIFYPDDRKHMVRVLATIMLSHIPKASMKDCEYVAKALVQKFPFLKEYGSWTQFIYVRCQNCNRPTPSISSEPKPKRAKVQVAEKHAYPSLEGEVEDETTHKRNVALLQDELDKTKPVTGNVKNLMTRTFLNRREWILNSTLPVSEIVTEYPCLKKVSYVAHEMDMVCHADKTISTFEEAWSKYASTILQYSMTHSLRNKEVKESLMPLIDDLPDNQSALEFDDLTDVHSLCALKCLNVFLVPKSKKRKAEEATAKKGGSSYISVPFLLMEAPNSTSVEECRDSENSHPYIIRWYDSDRPISTYKIFVEQEELAKCFDLATALFIVFSYHFIFNISYHSRVHDVFLFLQEMVFCIPVQGQKKSAAYLSFCAAIEAAQDNEL